ncbi:MAG: YpdA family putative bacillithiol disulfide reductase [Gemmatimonadaceae bacterium]
MSRLSTASGMTGGATDSVDVVIVGAGPCGLAAAIALQGAGLAYVVLDQSCLVSAIVGYPVYMTFFSNAEKLAIGNVPFTIGGEKPTRREALAYYRNVVSHFALRVRQYEPVHAIARTGSEFAVRSRTQGGDERETRCRAVVIATGYFGTPNRLGVAGEELPHVTHDFREGHPAFQQPVVVVGGGNSAAETALDLHRAGARVTLIHAFPELDKGIKPWVAPDLANRIAEGSIAAHYAARVVRIEPDHVVVAKGEGGGGDGTRERVPAAQVYLMIGYTPAAGLLRDLHVAIDEGTGIPAHDPLTMETTVPGIFVAGVIASGYDANKIFIENGRIHGARIAAALGQRSLRIADHPRLSA